MYTVITDKDGRALYGYVGSIYAAVLSAGQTATEYNGSGISQASVFRYA